MSKFWKTYASVSDDLRHHLIERAWFGREVTGNINEADMPALKRPEGQENTLNNFYGDSHTTNTINAFYGQGPAPDTPNNFYGPPADTAPAIEAPAIEAPKIEPPAPAVGPEPEL